MESEESRVPSIIGLGFLNHWVGEGELLS